jgi:superfamily I DNA and/or RNA helicase
MSVVSQKVSQKFEESNQEQKYAIEAILEGWEGRHEFIFPIVDGPPGTGKTRVGVLAASKYALERNKRQIAYLTYTNEAAEKAKEEFFNLEWDSKAVIRLTANQSERDWKKGIIGCSSDLKSLTDPDEQRRIMEAPILISTLYGSGRIFKVHRYPLIIVDEFSQVSPSLYFSTLSKITTANYNPPGYTLLGDPNQLPVITSQPLLRPNIGRFVFQRKNYDPHHLILQYRMHEKICEMVNSLREALWARPPLESHQSVKIRTLTDLGYIWDLNKCSADFQDILDPRNPCVIINTDNLPNQEERTFGKSVCYREEAQLVVNIAKETVRFYKDKNGKPLLPTILSPYNGQREIIQRYFQENQELKKQCLTIFKAQGREYPCVIISFTRKNDWKEIGFLGETFEGASVAGEIGMRAQTYVACSRAQGKLIILLSFKTFRGNRDYDFLLKKAQDNALMINAEPEWVNTND